MLSYSYMHDNKESAVFEIHDDADSIFDQWAQFIDYNVGYSGELLILKCDARMETVERIIKVGVQIDG